MHVKLPYGNDSRLVDLPDGWVGNRVLRSPRVDPPGPVEAILEETLQNPICSPPLGEVVPSRADICLAIDGWAGSPALTAASLVLLRALETVNSIPADRVQVVLTRPLGVFPALSSPPEATFRQAGVADISAAGGLDTEVPYRLAGTLKGGLDLHLHPTWLSARYRVAMSLIEPVPFWGYSGGRTVVLPGLADGETRRACLNNAERLNDPASTPGNLRNNPFHLMSLQAMQAAPPNYGFHALLNREGQVAALYSGDPGQAHLAAVNDHRTRFEPSLSEPMDIVLTGAGGHPYDATLASTLRSIVSAARLLKPEGTLVVFSRCTEGIGPPEFEALLREVEGTPADFFQHLEQDGLTNPAISLAHQLFRVLSTHEVLIHTEGIEEDDLWKFGLTPVPDAMEAINLAMETHGQECKIAVVPEGWRTLVRMA